MSGVVVPFDEAGVEGWTWANRTNGEIALRGAACVAVAASATATVTAVVKCGGT